LPVTVQMEPVAKTHKAIAPRLSSGVIEIEVMRAALAGCDRVIGLPSNTRVWIVAGHTDMRKGFDGLAAMVQKALAANPFCGHVLARQHA
jgi:transposase